MAKDFAFRDDHVVQFTRAKKDGEMGRTFERRFKSEKAASRHFDKMLKHPKLFGVTHSKGDEEIAQSFDM